MPAIHAACTGCLDPAVQVTATQLLGLVVIGAFALALVGLLLLGLSRYNR